MAENSGVRKSARKVRSKSLGPGGLDALLNAGDNKKEAGSSGTGKVLKRRESVMASRTTEIEVVGSC